MAKDITKKENKNKKHFWKDFKAELKKVIWPTPKQLFKNTIAVIFIVLVTAAIVFVLDVAFDLLNNQGINRVKSVVTNRTSENVIIDGEEQEELANETIESDEIVIEPEEDESEVVEE